MNRAEKKARKAILKLGLKAVPNVARVVVRKGRNTSFVITSPDVYKVPGSDTYCIFGHPDEDSGAGAGAGAPPAGYPRPGAGSAQDYARSAAQLRQSVAAPSGGDALEESADATGLEAKDIELVVTQAGVSRGKAVAALRKCGGDIVNAIMCVEAGGRGRGGGPPTSLPAPPSLAPLTTTQPCTPPFTACTHRELTSAA